VSFTALPLYEYLWGKSFRCSLDTRLGAPQNQSGLCGEEKNLASAGNRTPALNIYFSFVCISLI
jgi:hypothetical protein